MTTEPLTRLVRSLSHTLAAGADAELLARFIATRDPAAFEAIVYRHGPRVLAACRAVLRDEADVADAVQATFVVLMRRPRAVRRADALGSWLFGVAHRIALQARAARRRRERIEARARTPEPVAPDLSWREACAILHEELDRLPDKYRLPLLLCYLEGLSRDEAAARLGRTLDAVKRALATGRRVLGQRLTRRGVSLSAGLLAAVQAVEAEWSPDLVRPILDGTVRPGVAALAAAVRPGPRPGWIGAGLVVAALAVGAAFGGPAGRMGDPPKDKAAPAGPARAEGPAPAQAGDRVVFAGRVIDPDGKPVSGAKVFVTGYMHPYAGQRLDHRVLTTSDAAGRYQFELPRRYAGPEWRRWHRPILAAAAEGFGLGVLPFPEGGSTTADIRLVRDHPIRGRVVDLQGRAVVGATVRLRALHLPDEDDLTAALTGLREAGWYGFQNGLGRFRRRAGELRLAFPGIPDAHTEADGKFTLAGLGRDRLALLIVEGPGLATVTLPVLSEAGETIRVPLTPDAPASQRITIYRDGLEYVAAPTQPFEGTVTDRDSGRPIVGQTVRGYTDVQPSWVATTHVRAVTDANGRYQLLGLPDGRLTVLADPGPECPYFQFTRFGGRAGSVEPVRLDFSLKRAAWVTGRVVEVRSDQSVADAELEYAPARGNESYRDYLGAEIDLIGRCRTDANGRFRMPAAPGPGWMFVRAGSGLFVGATERPIQGEATDRTPRPVVEVEGEADRNGKHALIGYRAAIRVTARLDKSAEYVITTDAGVSVPVRLRDPDGKPVGDVVAFGARGWRIDWSDPLPSSATIEAFQPERPAPVVFYHPRELGLEFDPKAGDVGPWDLKLRPTATVTARLVRRNGDRIADATVRIHFFRQGRPVDHLAYEFRTDKDGRVRLTGVIGGLDYHLTCQKWIEQPGDAYEYPFRAEPGQTKDLGTIRPEPRK